VLVGFVWLIGQVNLHLFGLQRRHADCCFLYGAFAILPDWEDGKGGFLFRNQRFRPPIFVVSLSLHTDAHGGCVIDCLGTQEIYAEVVAHFRCVTAIDVHPNEPLVSNLGHVSATH